MEEEETVDTSNTDEKTIDSNGKPISPDKELNEISNEYLKRKNITAGEEYEAPIKKIGVINSSRIGLVIDIVGDDFVMEVDIPKDWGDFSTINDIIEKSHAELSDYPEIKRLIGERIPLYFNTNFTHCGIESDENFDYRIKPLEEVDFKHVVEFRDSVDEELPLEIIHIEKQLSKYIDYNKNRIDDEHPALKKQILEVDGECVEEDIFKVSLRIGTEMHEWELKTPFTTDKDENPVSRLIEEVGNGDIRFLENEYVYVARTEDVDAGFDKYVGKDKSEEQNWILLTPWQYDKWVDYDPSSISSPSESSETSTSSKRTERTESLPTQVKEWRQRRNKALIHGVIGLPLFDFMVQSAIKTLFLDAEGISPEGQDMINNLISTMDMFITFGIVIAFIMVFVAQMMIAIHQN